MHHEDRRQRGAERQPLPLSVKILIGLAVVIVLATVPILNAVS